MTMKYNSFSFHNSSVSVTQRRANNTCGRKDVIVPPNNPNVLSKLISEAKSKLVKEKAAAAASFQKKKNDNKRKILALQTEATQLDTIVNNLNSALESVALEEKKEIAKVRSHRMHLKDVSRDLRAERREKHEALLVHRTVFRMFSEEVEEIRKRKKSDSV